MFKFGLVCLLSLIVTFLALMPNVNAQMFQDRYPKYRVAQTTGFMGIGASQPPTVDVGQVTLSSIYAFFALILLIAIIAGIVWGCVCCCCRESKRRRKHHHH